MKVVCFHLNQIGDLLFSLPALRSLREWDPDGTLISVVRPSCSALLQRTSLPDLILVRENGMTMSKINLLLRLRAERPDAAVLFSQSAECIALAWLSGAPLRYGITTRLLDRLLTSHVSCSRPPSVGNNLKMLGLMGCQPTCTNYVGLIAPNQEDRESADALLPPSVRGSRIVVLAPGTSSRRSVKAWTTEGWASVIDHFASRPETVVAVVGTEDLAEILKKTTKTVLDLCGKTSLLVLLAILERADVVIGVDSGTLHLAAAVGTKVVGLYGMSDPKTTGPQGEGHVTISAGLDCSPCQLSVCKIGNKCMTSIDSGWIIGAGESILSTAERRC